MKLAYFDCFSGASGDMILGALIDAGLPADALREDLARLNLADYSLDIQKIKKQGFAATKVNVQLTGKPGHRHLKHIVEILDKSSLADAVRAQARAVFTRLAEAEAAAHNSTIEKVHFHEVGAVDAIVDVVGAIAALHRLGITRVECSPIPTGHGTVNCEHGLMPVPAPGTAALLKGVPILATDEPGELTTPTGAAILTTLAERFGPLPSMQLAAIGYGAGTRDGQTRPNLLRVLIGDTAGAAAGADSDEVVILEANLDDTTPQAIGYVTDRLLEAGALDVAAAPITMKKSRPGLKLSVIAPPSLADALENLLFLETTTFGVRRYNCRRTTLARTIDSVETRFGPICIKVGRRAGRVVIASPEYDDCAAAARKHAAPLREVMDEARRAWHTAAAKQA